MADPHPDPDRQTPDDDDSEDESLIDDLRGSGVGVEDPHIVGEAEPGIVDEQVQEDEPPQV